MATRKSSGRSGSKGGMGCLVWIIAFCVVFILFFLNFGKIQETLNATKFGDIFKDKFPVTTQSPSTRDKPPVPPVTVEEEPKGDAAKPSTSSAVEDKKPTSEKPVEVKPATPTATAASKPAVKPETSPVVAPSIKTRDAVLFFVKIDDDGVITRQEVKRTTFSKAPTKKNFAAVLSALSPSAVN
jgi:hypothetical protein